MTAAETIAAIRADARFATAAATLAADHHRTVADVITLTEIPTPPFAEDQRAAAYLAMPRDPPTTHCVSVVSGGTSINAIANAVTIEVDLRSASATELESLDQRFLAIAHAALATENAARSTAAGVITAEITRVGDRPAGETPEGSPIRAIADAAVAAEGYAPRFEFSSTGANVPMSLGIPALKVGAGGCGGRVHSLEEWLDVEPRESLRG